MKTNEIIARLEDMRFKLESQIINCENLLAELVDEDRQVYIPPCLAKGVYKACGAHGTEKNGADYPTDYPYPYIDTPAGYIWRK